MRIDIKKLLQEVVTWCYNPIYNYLGKRTKPLEAEQCELGDWWVRVYKRPPTYNYTDKYGLVYEYEYCYQGIKQDGWGRWRKEALYLGRNYSLAAHKIAHKRREHVNGSATA